VRAERTITTERKLRTSLERQRFIDAVGAFFTRYGAAATLGRVFALLLTGDEPLSLDDIAARLGISKSGTSVATRDLERMGLVRRQVSRGTRRILYEACDDMAAIFDAQFARISQQRSLFSEAEPLVHSARARTRLRRMLDLHDFFLSESAGIVERWRQR
jgi:DNA-binding transcriptional regulator GbsR (MarR family)